MKSILYAAVSKGRVLFGIYSTPERAKAYIATQSKWLHIMPIRVDGDVRQEFRIERSKSGQPVVKFKRRTAQEPKKYTRHKRR